MTQILTIPAEHQDLSTHVDICAQRYASLELRLSAVEQKVDQLAKTVETVRSDITKTLIGTAGTIVVSLITLAGVVIQHIK